MPVYNVNRANNGVWNVAAGPAAHRPTALINLAGNSQVVTMGNQANVVLGTGISGVHTFSLTSCSAICMLWQNAAGNFVRGSLKHMEGAPNPIGMNWVGLTAGMEPGGTIWAILANSRPTELTQPFIAAIPNIPAVTLWIYEANHPGGGINFGITQDGLAGEILQEPPPGFKVKPEILAVTGPRIMRKGVLMKSSVPKSPGTPNTAGGSIAIKT